MQYTSKLAILAVALFGTSALAAPYATRELESELEVREVDELSAREFFDAYLEVRADPSLDARDLEALDLDAREYFAYLEAREPASSTTPQSPLSATHSKGHDEHNEFHKLTEARKTRLAAKKAASEKFKDSTAFQKALTDDTSAYHKFAVRKHLSDSANLKKALSDKKSTFHKDAQRIDHSQKAKVFLADAKHYKKALKSKHHKYHKDAVKQYLSDEKTFQNALTHKRAHYHKEAVHEYLRDSTIRKEAIGDNNSKYHKDAVKLQKAIDHKKKHGKKHSKHSKHSKTHTESPAPTTTHSA